MNQREVSVLYDHLVVLIRHDTAEIRGLVVSKSRFPNFLAPRRVFFFALLVTKNVD